MPDLEIMSQQDGFVVDSDAAAEWCIRKIIEAKQDKAKWAAHYDAQMQKIAAEDDAIIAKMEGFLQGYMGIAPVRKTPTGQRKYKLPSAELCLKPQEPEIKRDETKVVHWLETNQMEECLDRTPHLKWQVLKARTMQSGDGRLVDTESGEYIPGITLEPRPDKFTVTIKKGEETSA